MNKFCKQSERLQINTKIRQKYVRGLTFLITKDKYIIANF